MAIILLIIVGAGAAFARSTDELRKPNLYIVVPGINDNGACLRDSAAERAYINPENLKRAFIISEKKLRALQRQNGWNAKQVAEAVQLQLEFVYDQHAKTGEDLIVVVDMDLENYNLAKYTVPKMFNKWDTSTKWAGRMVNYVANDFTRLNPTGIKTLDAHSAGVDAVRWSLGYAENRRLFDRLNLFNGRVLASDLAQNLGRCGYSFSQVMVFTSNGDYPASPYSVSNYDAAKRYCNYWVHIHSEGYRNQKTATRTVDQHSGLLNDRKTIRDLIVNSPAGSRRLASSPGSLLDLDPIALMAQSGAVTQAGVTQGTEKSLYGVVIKEQASSTFEDWVVIPETDGWVRVGKRGWETDKYIPVLFTKKGQDPDEVAKKIKKRNELEYPGKKAVIMLYGDPKSADNQAKIMALKRQGYGINDIYVLDKKGDLYNSDGALVETKYAIDDNPLFAFYKACTRMSETGRSTIGNLEIPDDSVTTGTDIDNDNDNDSDDDDDFPPPGGVPGWNQPNQPFPPPFLPPPIPRPLKPGGVLLNKIAQISSLDKVTIEGVVWDAEGQHLSLIVKGKLVSLPQTYLDDFTSILMTVYGGEDPGVSIDPGPTRNRMNVRYIGKVKGTRLGQIMFEADRILKGYTLGRDTLTGELMSPGIPGYKNMVELFKEIGMQYSGAMYRFWFVPAEVRAKQAGDALIFDRVKIEVKTEYMMQGLEGESEPAAQVFAQFFTGHYDEFARKHAELRDLREYAKLVALAKYLKDRGVPLNWFIFANHKPSVIYDTPEETLGYTIPWEETGGLEIWGGVDLAPRPTYISAWDSVPAFVGPVVTSYDDIDLSSRSFSPSDTALRFGKTLPALQFNEGQTTYTAIDLPSAVVTEHGREVVFQTDAVITGSGPVVELTRYYSRSPRNTGEFGPGWHLTVPFELAPSKDNRTFQDILIPSEMTVVDRITGSRDRMRFGNNKEGLAGYFPEDSARWEGLYIMSDSSYRLADIHGNTFHFNQARRLVLVDMGRENRWAYGYRGDRLVSIWGIPLGLTPGSGSPIIFDGISFPKSITVLDRPASEELVFGQDDKGDIGYFPPASRHWQGLYILQDGSFRLKDKWGNAFDFDAAGDFMTASINEKVSPARGEEFPGILLAYNSYGRVIAAHVGGKGQVFYLYDKKGNLTMSMDVNGKTRSYRYGWGHRLYCGDVGGGGATLLTIILIAAGICGLIVFGVIAVKRKSWRYRLAFNR